MNETVYGLKIFFFALQKRNKKWQNKSRSAGSPFTILHRILWSICHPLATFHRTHTLQKSYEQLTSKVFQYQNKVFQYYNRVFKCDMSTFIYTNSLTNLKLLKNYLIPLILKHLMY